MTYEPVRLALSSSFLISERAHTLTTPHLDTLNYQRMLLTYAFTLSVPLDPLSYPSPPILAPPNFVDPIFITKPRLPITP